MKTTCTLDLDFPDEATARNIAKALELDNAGYLETKVEGKTIHVIAKADDVLSLRNTIDDYLACVSVAQKSIEGTKN
jgi:tRNA threonylcarbamoyladenosine modification (KEOPS) complex  Pcc1 subunit